MKRDLGALAFGEFLHFATLRVVKCRRPIVWWPFALLTKMCIQRLEQRVIEQALPTFMAEIAERGIPLVFFDSAIVGGTQERILLRVRVIPVNEIARNGMRDQRAGQGGIGVKRIEE